MRRSSETIISIHAPARGATSPAVAQQQVSGISIHAPARGATIRAAKSATGRENFNPRSREGSDGILDAAIEAIENFNPRSREGSDRQNPQLLERTTYFNPRSREGSD